MNDQELLTKIREKESRIKEREEQLKEQNPFWFFQPTYGDLSKERKDFLKKWVKPEDMPQKMAGSIEIFSSAKPIKQILGGNRSGKTVTSVINAIIRVTGAVPYSIKNIFPKERLPDKWPVYRRHYGTTKKQIQEVLEPAYKYWLPKEFWHKQGWERTYNKQEKVLRLYQDGHKFLGHISFWSYDQDVQDTQGATLQGIDFDETPPKKHFDEAIWRMTTGKHMELNVWNTPTEGWGYVSSKLQEFAKEGLEGIESWNISTLVNPYTNLESIERALRSLTYEEILVRLLGVPASLSGHIYSGPYSVQDNIHLIEPFEMDWENYVVVRGLDPHPSKEAHCIEVAIGRNGKLYVVGAYKASADTEQIKKDLQKRAVDRKYRLAWTAYDSSWDYEAKGYKNINIIKEIKKYPNGVKAMRPSKKYDGSIAAGVDKIKNLLRVNEVTKEPGIYFWNTPEVRQVVEQVKNLERDASKNEDRYGKRDKILEGPMDFHACLRYVAQQNPRFIEPYEEETTPDEPERYI